jgi:hypothetical protein
MAMLKRIDKYATNELKPGFRVTFQDAEDEPYPLSYEGDVVFETGSTLSVKLVEVRAISPDRDPGAAPLPQAGEVMAVGVGEVAACRELPRE